MSEEYYTDGSDYGFMEHSDAPGVVVTDALWVHEIIPMPWHWHVKKFFVRLWLRLKR